MINRYLNNILKMTGLYINPEQVKLLNKGINSDAYYITDNKAILLSHTQYVQDSINNTNLGNISCDVGKFLELSYHTSNDNVVYEFLSIIKRFGIYMSQEEIRISGVGIKISFYIIHNDNLLDLLPDYYFNSGSDDLTIISQFEKVMFSIH